MGIDKVLRSAEGAVGEGLGKSADEVLETVSKKKFKKGRSPNAKQNRIPKSDPITGEQTFPDGSHTINPVNTHGVATGQAAPAASAAPSAGPSTAAVNPEGLDAANKLQENKNFGEHLADLFKRGDERSAGTSFVKGALMGGGAAAAGSMIYGGAHFMLPNNGEVNDPLKNIAKGAMVGAGISAALLVAHNAEAAYNLTKPGNPKWLNSLGSKAAPMVKNVLGTKVGATAVGVALAAGSGQFDLTRPVNPVY